MERMQKNTTAFTFIYVFLASVMFYLNNEYIDVGFVNVLYKFAISAFIPVISFFIFLVDTDLKKAKLIIKYMLLFSLPCFVNIAASVPVWFESGTGLYAIRRGLMSEIYNILIIITMGGFVYVFGKGAVWRVIAAALIANALKIIMIFVNGASVSEFIYEFITLIRSFAEDTGLLMRQAEVHEITFMIGAFITYLLLSFSELKNRWYYHICLILSVIFFLLGFKRIGAAGCLIAVCVGALLRLTGSKESRHYFNISLISLILVGSAFVYIVMIKHGFMNELTDQYGIDVMGRSRFYELLDSYYSLKPSFMGQGLGFTSRFFTDNRDLNAVALHNDILKVYIDMGFVGFSAWIFSYIPLRVFFIGKWQGRRGAILCLAILIYLFVTAFTDNTIYYTYVTGAAAVISMCFDFDAVLNRERDIQTVDSDDFPDISLQFPEGTKVPDKAALASRELI